METVNAVPVFLMFGCVAGLAVALFVIAALFNPRQYVGPVQKMPYESGMDPIHDTRRRFDVRFHLIAIAFLVFDVEVLFLYPWAVAANYPKRSYDMAASKDDRLETYPTPKATADWPESAAAAVHGGLKPTLPPEGGLKSTLPNDISAAVDAGLVSDRHFVFGGAMVFISLLALGFVYDWKKGVFQWR